MGSTAYEALGATRVVTNPKKSSNLLPEPPDTSGVRVSLGVRELKHMNANDKREYSTSNLEIIWRVQER
jgi:hypothetical protein